MRKIVPSVYVRTSAFGLGPYARSRVQFFLIRTSRPANNIYFFLHNINYCNSLVQTINRPSLDYTFTFGITHTTQRAETPWSKH